jgi:saccharopine dehydrogenase-like NADP-dependent oxidoreductase
LYSFTYFAQKIAILKNILLFGAGKSATVLIDYLLNNAIENKWQITISDSDKKLIEQKTNGHVAVHIAAINVTNNLERQALIEKADLVISMMPPFLHIHIAKDCLHYGKHLLTASYADDAIKEMSAKTNAKGIIFLCEMGLDPGIDHMSAMQIIDNIKSQGGEITSFKSHCGGLVAPESDNNPWHYKISWNPRNVVLAGKAGATYKKDGQIVTDKYESLFAANNATIIDDASIGELSFYPNRDSIAYIDLYNLHQAKTFLRTTLRHKAFMQGWKNIIDLKLTDETVAYQSDDISLASFFETHFALHEIDVKKIDTQNLTLLEFIGLNDHTTIINKGMISAADGLQVAIEKKLLLHPNDKDMIVMQHEIEYQLNNNAHTIISSLIVKGEDNLRTAMAKTVGLPLGIAAKLILNDTIKLRGLQLPISKEIYEPVLNELNNNGIVFVENKI